MKSLTLWTRYAALGASSRLRFLQFIPELEKNGWCVNAETFFDDEYLHNLYSGGGKSLISLFRSWLHRKRAMRTAFPETPAFIEYELLPYLPYGAEKKFLETRRYVLNFDDDVTLRYRRYPHLRHKFFRLAEHAAGVIVANNALQELFAPFNGNILHLPTVPPPLPEVAVKKDEHFTLVWTGTPITFPFLAQRQKALAIAAEKLHFKLLIVGGGAAIDGVDCEVLPWSERTEAEALARAHVGIMPLDDTPFARGKSAYKLIRYQQAGLPAAASPVGENCRVLTPEYGILARSDEEWVAALTALSDAAVRTEMQSALADAQEKYSFLNAANALNDFLTATLFI